MKTRKVGKLVSLILAIVLVATIMIPAVNVLAESSEYDSTKPWQTVKTFEELKAALDGAEADGTTRTYIKLANNITTPQGAHYDKAKGTLRGQVFPITEFYEYGYTGHNVSNSIQLHGTKRDLAEGIEQLIDREIFLPIVTTNPYDETWTGYFIVVNKDNASKIYRAFDLTSEDKWQSDTDLAYDDLYLKVYANTDVVVDLNSYSIKGSNTNIYSGTPQYSQPIFVVEGKLTVIDQNGGNGTISGGTGYVATGTYTAGAPSTPDNDHHLALDSGWNILGSDSGHAIQRKNAKWHFCFNNRRSYWMTDVTEIRGGGIYVEDGGTFTLESGKITNNCAWMQSDVGSSAKTPFKSGVDSVTKGGGVYVEAGGTFNMNGGEVSNNAARAYQKTNNDTAASAYGGGVYLENAHDGKVATMTMTGGKIAENAAHAITGAKDVTDKTKPATAKGAGIYAGTGSVLNVLGAANVKGSTTSEMLATFPQIVDNSCGAITRHHINGDVLVEGGGIYCAGTLNIKKAVVSSNDFAEFATDLGNKNIEPVGNATVTLDRDPVSGLPYYIYDYNEDGTPKTKITALDSRFTDNLEIATKEVAQETSGIYGSHRGYEKEKMTSDGAGICLTNTSKMIVGERTWITGNYDLITGGHKAFSNTRHYTRHWDKTLNNDAGGYVYDAYSQYAGDGYTWSDTPDDVYLPEGVTMYKGGSLFESRIGVNYYDMVDKDGEVIPYGIGQAGNRVFMKTGTDLDREIWSSSTAAPAQSDIQFFSLNDNNKNYERDIGYVTPDYEKAVHKDYYGGAVTTPANLCDLRGEAAGGPALPSWISSSGGYLQNESGNWSNSLNEQYRIAAVDASKVEGTVDGVDWTYRKDNLSPYIGYIDFSTKYPGGTTWSVEWSANFSKDEQWPKYRNDTYWMTCPDKDPTTNVMQNKNVVFPQKACQYLGDMNEYEKRAKFMDYKVVYDNSDFGTEPAPVLRFGKTDAATNQAEQRKMFVTINFDEANIHYFGLNPNQSANLSDKNTTLNVAKLDGNNTPFATINTTADGKQPYTFYGANRPKATITIPKLVPNYSVYKDASILNTLGTAGTWENNEFVRPATSINKTNGVEDGDLYFKGWSLYASYGCGPTVEALNRKTDSLSSYTGSNLVNPHLSQTALEYRGAMSLNLLDVTNFNVNAQPCPSLTATWYTKEELEEARARVSNVMVQNVIRSDGKVVLRVISIVGPGYEDYSYAGFVVSTKNATPTVEGGYNYVTKGQLYKKIDVTAADGTKQWYDTDVLLGGQYYTGDREMVHKGKQIVNAKWKFSSEESEKAFKARLGEPSTNYVKAGMIYVDIVVGTYSKDTGISLNDNASVVYFVTPYACIESADKKIENNTYYYGESRAVCYSDINTTIPTD